MHSLILFDIDGTMLVSGRAGIRAMEDAGRDLFGPTFSAEGIDVAGRLDPLIITEMFVAAGIEPTAENRSAFRHRYGERLRARLSAPDCSARAMPGVHELVLRLAGHDGVTLGVLSGNFAETGRMKIERVGIDTGMFPVSAWGDDSPHDPPTRSHLPPVAIARFRQLHGLAINPGRVTIIGDTPHDVHCAAANGCRSLAVATGQFTVEALQATGADRTVPDLADTPALLNWLLSE